MQTLDTLSIGRPARRGAVALFPLYAHGPRRAEYVAGPVAAAAGLLTIDEIPEHDVPTLVARVAGDAPVLLVEGETFVGGLQNRVLNVSVLLAPGVHEIPVACVEARRWGARTEMRRAGVRAPRALRRVKNESVARSVREHGDRHADQAEVWATIDEMIVAGRADAPTAALHDAFEAAFRAADAHGAALEELAALGPLPDQTGVVVASGNRCVTAELFDRHDTLAAYWREIVCSHVVDAPGASGQRPTLGDALRFVRAVRKAERHTTPGVGLGREHHYTGTKVAGTALEHDDTLVHLSVLAA